MRANKHGLKLVSVVRTVARTLVRPAQRAVQPGEQLLACNSANGKRTWSGNYSATLLLCHSGITAFNDRSHRPSLSWCLGLTSVRSGTAGGRWR